MNNRLTRWSLFTAAAVFFLISVFGAASVWSVAGFILFGGAWYGLAWRKARELDAPKPK